MGKWETIFFEEILEEKLIGLVRNTKQQSFENDVNYLKMNNITNDGNLDLNNLIKVNASIEEIEKYKLKKGDFLFNTRNSIELVGKTAVYNEEKSGPLLFNNNIMRSRFKSDFDPYFINYQFQSTQFKERLEKIKSGTTSVAAIYYKSLKDIILKFPPLPEQQRIVAKLDALFEKIDKAIALLEENIQHTQALMGSVLDEEFGKLENYEILTIDEVKESNVIGLVRSSKIQDYDREFDYLKMNNITRNGDLDLSDVVCVDATKEEFEKFSLKKGDFLFNTRNSIELVGKTAVYDLDKSILYNNNIMRLRFREGVNPYFVNFQFFTNKTKMDLEKIKSGTTSVAAVYYKTFKNLELKIPKIETQNKIVEKLSEFSNKLNQTTAYQTQKLNNLKALKSSLLDKAFIGEL